MEFFDVLLILMFIVIPLIEGVLKQRRKPKEGEIPPGASVPRQPEPVEARTGTGMEVEEGPADDGAAADMIPADLWEVLTGEKRPSPVESRAPWEPEEVLEEEQYLEEAFGAEEEPSSTGWDDWRTPEERPQPVSLEYVGPEAITMEVAPPPPEVRHRRFHEKYDEEPMAVPVRRSGLTRELRSGLRGEGLRRSVLLAEILGPPKGLA